MADTQTIEPTQALFVSRRDGSPEQERDDFINEWPGLRDMLDEAGRRIKAHAPEVVLDLTFFGPGTEGDDNIEPGVGSWATPKLELAPVEFALDVPRDVDLYERQCNWDFPKYVELARRPDLETLAEELRQALAAKGWDIAVLVDILY